MKHFISKYWLTTILIVILSSLMYQNFWVNKFPLSLMNKQAIINEKIKQNQLLSQQNKTKSIKLKAIKAKDKEILESQARYRFGLIKKRENYYQINDSISSTANNP